MLAINGEGHVTRRVEGDPLLPFRSEVIGAERLHEGGKGFIQPNAFPPAHGDEVTKPHVGKFMVDDQCHSLEFIVARRARVNEQFSLSEGHATEVLHGSSGEVRDRNEVEFVARVGNVEVVSEEGQCKGRNLHGPVNEVALAKGVDHPDRCASNVDWGAGLKGSNDKGNQIRRHLHRWGEMHLLQAIAEIDAFEFFGVGVRPQVTWHDEGCFVGRLERGFVKAREGSAGIGGFELRGGNGVRDAISVSER